MNKNILSILMLVFITGVIYVLFSTRMPQDYSKKDLPLSEFSSERALQHIEYISQKPHYVGSPYHAEVRKYLENELQKLGLETQIQKGNTLSKWGNLVSTSNVMARIKGNNNGKALLLLTHYDSAPHSNSYGASDDANGLGVILEGIRTFLHNKTPHKNDIIILFSDGEELGLNGAYDFAENHPWANDVGLVINFEARGTKGPSMMLAETNAGNAGLIHGFNQANTTYPVSNSLMYSVYKMLPNDTDLTAFREKKNIPGFNLAYIDDHFDYHTEQDNFENFSPTSLEHQATYLMPMLHYFSNSDLTVLKSKNDKVYFNFFNFFIQYPFSWNWILFALALLLFAIVGFFGVSVRKIEPKNFMKGFLKIIFGVILSAGLTFGGWKLILKLNPEHADMLHGFPYQGHAYMYAFFALSLAVCLWIFKDLNAKRSLSYLFSVNLIWLIINAFLLIYLPGAGFLIIPVIAMLIGSLFFIFKMKLKPFFIALLAVPTLGILIPLIELFPIGLGLKILPGSAVLLVLTFGLLLPLFGWIKHKNKISFLMLLISFSCFAYAHLNNEFMPGKAKQNSLVYLFDEATNKAYFATYDQKLDDWTQAILGENPQSGAILNQWTSKSKYNTGFQYRVNAPKFDIKPPTVFFLEDTIIDNLRKIKLEVSFNRPVNRLDVFAEEFYFFHHLKANGVKKINQEGSQYKRKDKQLQIDYPINQEPLILEFYTDKNQKFELMLRESSFDLLSNPAYQIQPRPDWAIPMPFVLNNAVIIQKKITTENTFKKTSNVLNNTVLDSIKLLEPLLNEYN
jgi:hypothetical protein